MMAAIGVVCALSQLDHQIQKQVLDELQTRFPDLHVEIGSTDLVSAKGISIKMLEISTHDLPGAPAKPLLNIAEMFVECPVTIQSFLNDEITIRRIIIRNPIARLTRNVDGTIDELQYLPSQQHSSLQSCPIEIIGGTLLYEDKRADAPEPIKVTGIDVTFDPPKPESDADVLSDVETRYPTQSNAQTPKMSLWRFKGSAKGDLFRQLQYEGLFDPQTKYWECTGRCRQFDWTSDLFRYLPEYRIPDTFSPTERNQLVKTIESFQGRFDCTFTCSKEIPSDPTSTPNKNIRFTIDGELSQGRAKLFAMDLMLSELNGMFHLSDKGLLVNKLNGLGEAARLLNFSYRQEGWHQGVDAQLYLQVTGVNVNPKLTQALSPVLNDKVEELLRKFDYSATAQIEAEFKRTRNHWHPKSLTLNVTDLALTSLEFPYRVDRLAGQLRLDDSATIQYAFKTPTGEPVWVEILGRYENIFTDEFGHMLIRGTDVPIDAKLLQAIPESYRAVVQSLNPVGKIAASFVIKNPPGDAPSEKEFQIGLDGISVRYDKFPYPLTDTYGLLTFKDGDWIFENIIAKGESTEVACKGHLKRISNEIGKNGFEFFINIGAVELPIDGEIRKALINPNHRELLENLYAKGKVKLDASVLYRSDDNQLNIGFLAQPLAGMSMVPVHFPYRIEDVQGDFLYNNGTMTVKRFRGENRETKISADIVCQLNPNGSWQLDMNELHIDRLQLKKELLEAMPKTLLQIVDELQVQGAINLKGAVRFSKESTVSPLRTIWDIGIVLHQNSAKIGLSLQNIYGNLLLSGISEGERTRVSGELQLTSLTTNGMQLNNVSGPFFYDGDTNLIYLGQKAQAALTPSPEIAYESFHKSGWLRLSRKPGGSSVTSSAES